ncbi:class E sortase [Saccharothrix sp. HUAS TT1]|uniref:class E sortase n=1 Tax=unclassified Saccharothrix TaxID=2593673 RepID=UPI00345B70C7
MAPPTEAVAEPPAGRRARRDDVPVEPPAGRRARRDDVPPATSPAEPPAGRRARRDDVPPVEPQVEPPAGRRIRHDDVPPAEPPVARRARRDDSPPVEPPYAEPVRSEPPAARRARRADLPVESAAGTVHAETLHAETVYVEPVRVDPPPGRRALRDDSAPREPVPPAGARRHPSEDPANRPAPVDVAARLGGAPLPQPPQQPPPSPGPHGRPGPRPHPGAPLDADATRYTNAFSGSLPPPPGARPPAPPRRPRPVDPPTEVIAPVADDEHDEHDDYEDEYYEDDDYYDDEDDQPPPPPPDSTARKAVRTVGELLITMGLVILLFVVYEVYVTDLISAGKQDDATQALDDQWSSNTVEVDQERQAQYDLLDGQAFAKMYIPVFGPDYKFSVVEGTTDKDLEIGPGHYKGTALPGDPGNFSVAGHRVGKGAPFNDLDLLNSCDAIVVETQTQWFVYRVLPKAGEVAGWAQKQATPQCEKVSPLGAPYDRTVGQEIVLPTQGEVIDPVPHFAGEVPVAQQAALMTLTTCHPRFSDKQRLIVHSVLTMSYPKAPGFVPEEMKEQ